MSRPSSEKTEIVAPPAVGEIPDFPFPREHPLQLPARYAHLRAHEPVSRVRIWSGAEVWLISRYEDGREVLKRSESLTSNSDLPAHPHQGPGTSSQRAKRSLVSMDPPEHSFRRQMVAGEFAVNRIERLRPAILATVARQLDGMQLAGPPADLLEHYARPIPSSVIAAMLGIPDGDDEFFQENTLMITSGGVSVSDGAAATQRLWDYLERLMHTKQAEASDDMLSRFVEFVAQGHITYEEAVNGALELLIGGHETTAHQIALGVLTLLENPHQLAALKQDPANIKPAVEEILRFINVTQAGRRRVATEDIEVGGQVIRAGEALIVAGDSGNHDESVFENPERFDISRDARGHVAFGYGIHQCVGQRLARAEVQIAIAELWRRMPNLRLAVPFDQLEFREGAVVYGLNSLPVEW